MNGGLHPPTLLLIQHRVVADRHARVAPHIDAAVGQHLAVVQPHGGPHGAVAYEGVDAAGDDRAIARVEDVAVVVEIGVVFAAEQQHLAVEQRDGEAEAAAADLEGAGGGVVDLQRVGLAEELAEQDAAIGQARGAGVVVHDVGVGPSGEAVSHRVIQLGGVVAHAGAEVEAADDEHAAVGERDGGVEAARVQHRAGGAELVGGGVVQLGAGQRGAGIHAGLAAGDEHLAVGQQGGAVAPVARHRRRAGGQKQVQARGIHLGGARGGAAGGAADGVVVAADDQHIAGEHQGGGVADARLAHVAGGNEGAGDRQIQFGAIGGAGGVHAAGEQHGVVAERHHRHEAVPARMDHLAAGAGEGVRGRRGQAQHVLQQDGFAVQVRRRDAADGGLGCGRTRQQEGKDGGGEHERRGDAAHGWLP